MKINIQKTEETDMDEGYKSLYVAIWEKAVIDELSLQKRRLFRECLQEFIPELPRSSDKRWDSYVKIEPMVRRYGSKDAIKRLEAAIKKYEDEIKKAVQNKIYRETERWPKNTKANDTLYEKQYREIKVKISKLYYN